MEEKRHDVFEEAMLFLGRETLARNGMMGVLRVVETKPKPGEPGKTAKETA